MPLDLQSPIPILAYHQTDTPLAPKTPFRNLVLSPGRFACQMRALQALGWKGLSLRDLGPYLRGERQGKVVGLTFDDGYLGTYQHALPVLSALGFSATVFAVSRQLGGSNLWDAALGVPRQPLMGTEHLRDWIDCGMEVGAHTCHHVDLTACSAAQAREEILLSRHDLEEALGSEVISFCYPYGRSHATHAAFVREAGYEWAAGATSQRAGPGSDPWLLPRITVQASTSLPMLLMQVTTGWEDLRRALARTVKAARLLPNYARGA